MPEGIFIKGDILLPKEKFETWSVVACDQFTSEPQYWEETERIVGDDPSSLRLMLPEAWLRTERGAQADVTGAMRQYLESGVFRNVEDSFVYVERTLSGSSVRHGLVGLLDIEAYDYATGSVSPVRATEGTVAERLPARVKVRMQAPLEMPHIIVFIDDQENSVMSAAEAAAAEGEVLYDFELMQGGGRLRGRRISGSAAAAVEKCIGALGDPAVLERKYGKIGKAPAMFAVGDGNHSLAAAKLCWEEIRKGLTPEEAERHPARYSLVELVNIHDSAVGFEPIHRVIFDTDSCGFVEKAREVFASCGKQGEEHRVVLLRAGKEYAVDVYGPSMGEIIGLAENFCKDWCARSGGRLDYIHGGDTARSMCSGASACGILLPAMDKDELFPSIIRTGAFPRKSFSIGLAADKRYYTECRRIK